MKLRLLSIVLCFVILLSGCCPLNTPMVVRLDDDSQKEINEAWNNLLNPIDRADRQLLLDVLIAYQMYHFGVDTFELRAVKRFNSGTVVMQIYYDRNDPVYDRFVIEIFDPNWVLLRRESYNRQEVEIALKELSETEKIGDVNEERKKKIESILKIPSKH